MAIASYERTLVPDQSPFDLGTEREQRAAGALQAVRSVRDLQSSQRLFTDGARR